jgi:DNA polymerase elongation subunit (family B)
MREVVLDIETAPCDPLLWEQIATRLPSIRKKGLERTGLDRSLGQIVCVGLIVLDGGKEREISFVGSDEINILNNIWAELKPMDYLIGHNLLGFDLPFLLARSTIRKVKPTRKFDFRKYSTSAIFDTMQVWANWTMDQYPKLDLLAAVLGLEGKSGSGNQVAEWVHEEQWERIREYCMQDVRLTRDIYHRMRKYGYQR